jgi:ribonuclease HI
VVYHQNYHKFHAYIPLVKRTTRSGSLYILLGEVNVVPIMVVPITVSKVEEDVVVVKGDGPCLPRLQPIRLLFWEAMQAGGGHWMWDYVSDKESDPLWLKEALKQGSAILATDGSYSRTKGPHVSGAGWVIACRKTHRLLKGSFYENSRDASPYRGELLGLVALHTIILQICKYYNLQLVRGKIICNSKLALNQSSKQYRRVSAGTPQADLFRALRSIHQEIPSAELQYEWVKSHQDECLPWRCLTLEEQLNTTCDTLANSAVTRLLTQPYQQEETFLLPFEQSAVVIDGVKITSNIAPTVRFTLGKVEAQRFYTKAINRVQGSNKGGLGWTPEAFEAVDWDTLARVTKINLEGFQLWLSKQAIGVCATQKNTA